MFFGVGVVVHGYGNLEGLSAHPGVWLVPTGAAALGSLVTSLVLLGRPRMRRFGVGVLVGVLMALVVELGGLAAYLVQVVGD